MLRNRGFAKSFGLPHNITNYGFPRVRWVNWIGQVYCGEGQMPRDWFRGTPTDPERRVWMYRRDPRGGKQKPRSTPETEKGRTIIIH